MDGRLGSAGSFGTMDRNALMDGNPGAGCCKALKRSEPVVVDL